MVQPHIVTHQWGLLENWTNVNVKTNDPQQSKKQWANAMRIKLFYPSGSISTSQWQHTKYMYTNICIIYSISIHNDIRIWITDLKLSPFTPSCGSSGPHQVAVWIQQVWGINNLPCSNGTQDYCLGIRPQLGLSSTFQHFTELKNWTCCWGNAVNHATANFNRMPIRSRLHFSNEKIFHPRQPKPTRSREFLILPTRATNFVTNCSPEMSEKFQYSIP